MSNKVITPVYVKINIDEWRNAAWEFLGNFLGTPVEASNRFAQLLLLLKESDEECIANDIFPSESAKFIEALNLINDTNGFYTWSEGEKPEELLEAEYDLIQITDEIYRSGQSSSRSAIFVEAYNRYIALVDAFSEKMKNIQNEKLEIPKQEQSEGQEAN